MFPNDSPPSSLLPSSSTRPKRCLSTSEMVVFIESRRDRVRSFYVILLNLLSASFVFCTTNIQRLVSSSHHSDHGNLFITDIFSSYLIVITQPGYRMSKWWLIGITIALISRRTPMLHSTMEVENIKGRRCWGQLLHDTRKRATTTSNRFHKTTDRSMDSPRLLASALSW